MMRAVRLKATIEKGATKPGALERRFLTFVAEQFPFALPLAREAWRVAGSDAKSDDELRALGDRVLAALVLRATPDVSDLDETTPMVEARVRLADERKRLEVAVEGFFEREALRASFTDEEKRWMLNGIVLTRAVDNRMKQIFLSSELKYGALGFQGKGFRSTGQEAIYAATLRLRRGDRFSDGGRWRGDVVAPLIRDLGVFLAFTDDVTTALNAQAGKEGPPMNGKDLHLGAPEKGVVFAAAPLSIATCTVTGVGLAMKLRGEERVGVSFIGEGGSSLGEWHEAINLAAVRKLPVIFCLENNQTALSTPVHDQSAVRTFADKAAGYGMPHLTLDGTDPEALAAAFAWAAERARRGHGPTLLEVVAMRMCGHAHHDDMLYLGGDPQLSFELPPSPDKGYVDAARYDAWAKKDPLASYAKKLTDDGVVTSDDVERMKVEALKRCDEAFQALVARPWPDGALAGQNVTGDGRVLVHPSANAPLPLCPDDDDSDPVVELAPEFSPKGTTYLEAVARGIGDALAAYPESFLFGEDVGFPYGNAFLLLKPLIEEHKERIWNAPLAEAGIIGALVGAALEGMRPIGEMQFNDFVATGFNELVNNAAKTRYRTGQKVPLVLRMPWGGLRRAGPYHSQDTSPWFYRTFGLHIVAPSTPHDARALMMTAVQSEDPVLYYEHIGLYRDPKIKQLLEDNPPAPIPLGKAAFRRLGTDLSLVSYGAYVHKAFRAAERLEQEHGVTCDVLDLRSLSPLDYSAIQKTVKRTGKLLLVGEDSRTGSILESIASRVSESLFDSLDAPVRVLGALDAPVPYAPSLEDAYLASDDLLYETARALAEW